MRASIQKLDKRNSGRKKGETAVKVLDILQTISLPLEELFVISTSPYGSSYSQIMRRLNKYRLNRDKFFYGLYGDLQNATLSRGYFQDLIYRLKKEGLIAYDKNSENKKIIRLTALGKIAIRKNKLQKLDFLPLRKYKQEKDQTIKIIIFDIPERERRKRDWLRGTLLSLGFTMLQKSVWVGRSKIPEAFLRDLKTLEMLKYVEIFSIGKTGTLKKIE